MRRRAVKALRWWTALTAALALMAAVTVVTLGTPSSGNDGGTTVSIEAADDDHDQLFVNKPSATGVHDHDKDDDGGGKGGSRGPRHPKK